MDFAYTLPLALAAALLDVTVGYPLPLYRAIRHPVVWMRAWGQALGRPSGVAELALYLAPIAIAPIALAWGRGSGPIGFAVAALIASTLLSQQALDRRVRAIALALERGEGDAAREAATGFYGSPVAHDEASIARAALDALARHFARGVVAPLFWIALAGLAGGAVCKAVEVARGVGPSSAAGRLDAWLGAPGDALGALLLLGAARLTLGAVAPSLSRAQPLADWPSAALMETLGVDPPHAADAADLRRGLALYRRAAAIEIFALAAGALAAAAW